MAKILRFPGAGDDDGGDEPRRDAAREPADRKPPKFGLTRVRRRPRADSPDQMDLFTRGGSADVLDFPGISSPFEQALASDEAGDEAAARGGYLAAIQADDCTPDAYCNLGILEFVGGHTERAFDCFRQALKHDPRHWESHYNLGNLYFDGSQHDPARVHYEMASQIAGDFRNVFFNLGLVLALQADYGAAIDAMERFRELAPEEEAAAAEDLLDTLRSSKAHAEARTSPD